MDNSVFALDDLGQFVNPRRMRAKDGGVQVSNAAISGNTSLHLARCINGSIHSFDMTGYSAQPSTPNYSHPTPILQGENLDLLITPGQAQQQAYRIAYALRALPDGTADSFGMNQATRCMQVVQKTHAVVLLHCTFMFNEYGFCQFDLPAEYPKIQTNNALGYSNYYPCYPGDQEGIGFVGFEAPELYLYFDRASTGILGEDSDDAAAQKMNAWLAQKQSQGNPLTVSYRLAVPRTHELAYFDIAANGGLTIGTSAQLPFPMQATYTRLGI